MKNRGFTLIELLVVIAIIGILAAIIMVSLGSARAKARDVRKMADTRSLMSAMELYKNDNSDVVPTQQQGFNALVTAAEKYISKVPSAEYEYTACSTSSYLITHANAMEAGADKGFYFYALDGMTGKGSVVNQKPTCTTQ